MLTKIINWLLGDRKKKELDGGSERKKPDPDFVFTQRTFSNTGSALEKRYEAVHNKHAEKEPNAYGSCAKHLLADPKTDSDYLHNLFWIMADKVDVFLIALVVTVLGMPAGNLLLFTLQLVVFAFMVPYSAFRSFRLHHTLYPNGSAVAADLLQLFHTTHLHDFFYNRYLPLITSPVGIWAVIFTIFSVYCLVKERQRKRSEQNGDEKNDKNG